MFRFLRLLLLTGEQLPWTPALHQLFPRPFKRAVCTLLLCMRAGHEASAGKGNDRPDEPPALAAHAASPSSTRGCDHATPSSSHYSDAESAEDFRTPEHKGGRPGLEDDPPMFTPFDVRLQAPLGEESSQDEVPSPELSAASEVTSTGGGRVCLPWPVVVKLVGMMAYPTSAWLVDQ